MKKKFSSFLLGASIFCLVACSAEYNFGAPDIGAIVDTATPASLKTTSRFSLSTPLELLFGLRSAWASATCTAVTSVSNGCGTASEFVSFIRSEVFQDIEGVAAPMFYRYWVDMLDSAMEETNTRLATSTPSCTSQTAVAVDFAFNINATAVTVSPKLQCWETQTGQGATTQNMAFGKDDDYFYLVYRTNDNATTGGSGIRIVIAKAGLDGNTADIWFVGTSYQSPIGGGTAERRGNVQRVLANKETGAFTFNTVEEDDTAKAYLFGSFFANTDGTNIYFEGAYGDGTTINDVTGMTRSSPYCALVSTITTAGSGTCTSLNASNLPTGFGLTSPMTNSSTGGAALWQANTSAETNFETAIDTIVAIDYAAAGIGEFQSTE